MLAVRWHGNRDVRLEQVELELPLGAGMLEAEVAFCGICGRTSQSTRKDRSRSASARTS
jgi:threonine dehydrogenase-like Zn-dependent dehydrogenase